MVFKFYRTTGEIYDSEGNSDGYEGYYFDYDVDDEEAKEEVVRLVANEYFRDLKLTDIQCEELYKGIKSLTDDTDNWEDLFEYYNEELTEIFEDEALSAEANND